MLPARSRRRKSNPDSRAAIKVICRQTQQRDVGLSVRFDEHVATNFAQCLLNPIFRFVGGRLIEVRCRFVGFDRNADEKSFGCFAASEQGG